MGLDIIILAGGKGTRMNSDLPKPLHTVEGIPTIARILASVRPICRSPIVVVGDRAADVVSAAGKNCRYIFQREQRGTGHAVQCVKECIGSDALGKDLMVLPGDHPLFETAMLRELALSHQRSRAIVTLCTLAVPHFKKEYRIFSDYGRIQRDQRGRLSAIVEAKDADTEGRRIKEVNVGCYCFQTAWLWKNIDGLTDHNAAGELYLTDLARAAVAQKIRTNSYILTDLSQGMGFNTPEQLEMIRKKVRS